MRLKKTLLVGAALCLAAGASIATGSSPVSAKDANTDCNWHEFPVTEASASILDVQCAIQAADSGNPVLQFSDFTNVEWHNGAARAVTGNCTAGSKNITTSAGIVLGAGSGNSDVNHSIGGTLDLDPRTFVTAAPAGISGPGATITVSKPALKSGSCKMLIESGPGRSIGDGVLTNGSTNLVSGDGVSNCEANFNASDVGHLVSGTSIPYGVSISSITNPCKAVMNHAAQATTATTEAVSIGGDLVDTTARVVFDLHSTAASTTITSATANFSSQDIGLYAKCTCLPANDYITGVTNATTATVNQAATKTVNGNADPTVNQLQIGVPDASAPASGKDVAATIQTELVLNPSLVAGVQPCSNNLPAGTGILGLWENADKFVETGKGLFFNKTNLKVASGAIGQYDFGTAVTTFAAYVVPNYSSPGVPDGTASVWFPFLPTAFGVCPGTATASDFHFDANTWTQQAHLTGTGHAGGGDLRTIKPLNFGGASSTGTAVVASYSYDSNAHTDTLQWLTTVNSCTVVRPAPLTSISAAFTC